MSELHRKYRPEDWSDVIGQDTVVKSLKAVLKKRTAHSFLLTGPSGVGKTTLARIIAYQLGCQVHNLLEVDAATHTGIDAMRSISDGVQYKGFGESELKVVVVDEAHALSKNAWQSLLKAVEEPPEHVYWIFCTTESSKIPRTIQTRCTCYELKPVTPGLIEELLARVVESESYKTSDDVLGVISRQSLGSPRRALTYLAQCYMCRDKKTALDMLQKVDEEDGDIIVLARALVRGGLTWSKFTVLLKPLTNQSPESIRLVTLAYLTTVCMNAKSEKQAVRCLEMMECLSEPFDTSAGFAPLLLAFGELILK